MNLSNSEIKEDPTKKFEEYKLSINKSVKFKLDNFNFRRPRICSACQHYCPLRSFAGNVGACIKKNELLYFFETCNQFCDRRRVDEKALKVVQGWLHCNFCNATDTDKDRVELYEAVQTIINAKKIPEMFALAKAEIYKEFAELLKKHSYYDRIDQRKVVSEIIIDFYLKKVGEDK